MSHQTWLRERLDRYAARHMGVETEQKTTQRILDFMDHNDNCFHRTNLSGHITGSAWITNETFDSVLIMRHKKLDLWLQLGGHADGNGDILEVALREAQEESGLPHFHILSPEIFDVDIHTIPARGHEPEHQHYDIRFLFQTNSFSPLKMAPEEATDLAWVPLHDILVEPHYEHVKKMAAKTSIFITSISKSLEHLSN